MSLCDVNCRCATPTRRRWARVRASVGPAGGAGVAAGSASGASAATPSVGSGCSAGTRWAGRVDCMPTGPSYTTAYRDSSTDESHSADNAGAPPPPISSERKYAAENYYYAPRSLGRGLKISGSAHWNAACYLLLLFVFSYFRTREAVRLMKCTPTAGWLVGAEFNAPLDTIEVISEAVFTANHLIDTDKQTSAGKYR